MGLIRNQNSTQSFSGPDASHWESMPQESSDYTNIIIVLGMLTFALQLCLALFVMLRCKNLDNKARGALKYSQTLQKVQTAPPSCHRDILKKTHCRQLYYDDDDDSSSATETCCGTATATNRLFGPSIPWDLVQH